jgi:hypothetical protein
MKQDIVAIAKEDIKIIGIEPILEVVMNSYKEEIENRGFTKVALAKVNYSFFRRIAEELKEDVSGFPEELNHLDYLLK